VEIPHPFIKLVKHPFGKEKYMSTLDTDLNKISSKLDKMSELMNDIALDVIRLDDDYDLLDFSVDHLEGWRNSYMDVETRFDHSLNHFNEFAFDGDSIREYDAELDG
jgi:hypothetical protein